MHRLPKGCSRTLFAASFTLAGAMFTPASHAAMPTLSPAVQAYVAHAQPLLAITNVRVIDGNGTAAKEDQTVLLRDGRIEAVGRHVKLPKNATVIDGSGQTLIPGLVGMHDHMFYPAPRVNPAATDPMYPEQASSFPKLYLAAGVTTIRTTGSTEPYTDMDLKTAIDAGLLVGPKMHTTGPYLEGKGSFTPQMHELTGVDDARNTVNYWIAEGATSFKAYMNITRAELSAAIAAAHAKGVKVTGHLCSIGFTEAADLGIDDLEHGLFVDTEFTAGKQLDVCPDTKAAVAHMATLSVDSTEIQGLIKHLVARHVAVTSTLPVFETMVPGRAPQDARVLDAMLPQARVEYLKTRERVAAMKDSPWTKVFQLEMDFERAFVKAGGTLMAGLDPTGYGGVIAGYGDQREVELLVDAGFTPVQAIQIASLNGARFMGVDKDIGSIEVGKAADMVLVKGNPANNIKDIENVVLVFKDGVGYDSAMLVKAANGTVGLR
ncbi:amidohydrolase family protein [Rhodanobacter sp. AS-Z3]|uniref:amidohydrolase family protein n=1 Tax=Rhodanobacter sp. AS-Z3 TaxID=3031330 RepID=UPI00247AFE05|nr:amidohydrolase family protein [Rhodanobacter sp. AS-Z3]WEN14367.1 amidohydrolase family protein [Rhodanobacter sp. AS-Z3]